MPSFLSCLPISLRAYVAAPRTGQSIGFLYLFDLGLEMIAEEIFKINCPCMCLGVFRVSGCEKHLKWLWELPSEVLILPPCTFIVSTQPDHARSHSSPLFLHSAWIQRLGSLSCGSGDSVVIWGLDPEPYTCRVYAVPRATCPDL